MGFVGIAEVLFAIMQIITQNLIFDMSSYKYTLNILKNYKKTISKDHCCFAHLLLNIEKTYFNKVDFFRYLGHYAEKICGQIVWVKPNGQPSPNIRDGERSVTNSIEFFIFLSNKRTTFKSTNLELVRNFIIENINTVHFEGHHAIMKYEVAEKIIGDFTREGEIVLDPFFGMGTTGVACKKLGRNYIGIELYKGYCEQAQRRIDEIN